MAGRTIPLEEVLKLQERLAKHYRQTERQDRNVTSDKTALTKVEVAGTLVRWCHVMSVIIFSSQDSAGPGPVTEVFQATLQRFVPGFMLSRGRREATPACQMSEEGEQLVLQALMAARRMLELVLEAERSGEVPSEEEIAEVVAASQQDGQLAGNIAEKLGRAALHYWSQSQRYLGNITV